MSRIKHLVMGIDPDELSKIVGNLIAGEVEGEATTLVSIIPEPKVYQIDPAGTVRPMRFEQFLGQVVVAERRKRTATGPGEKLIMDVVKEAAKVVD